VSGIIESLTSAAHSASGLRRILASTTFPRAERDGLVFVFVGQAESVRLRNWVFGLETSQPMQRIPTTDVWHLTLPLPPGSRVEYKLEVTRDGQTQWIRDPLNPHLARDPFGANSVAHGVGYTVPEWIVRPPDCPRGTFESEWIDSSRLGRREVRVYLPARFREGRRFPLLIVHDGEDYLRYASLAEVLDNLMARREIPDLVVALTSSPDRLVEYANDERHAAWLTEELVPALERRFPLLAQPQSRCLMGASFGAVAAFSTAVRYPGFYGKLLLQSGSFAFTDIGDRNHRGPVFDPVVRFMNGFRGAPAPVSERIYLSCGAYESLIYENRSIVPVLEATGMDIRFREARDGHNWENWRDRLREGLSWLFPGAFLLMYE
jgi:enterochelin esterase-like enzyme